MRRSCDRVICDIHSRDSIASLNLKLFMSVYVYLHSDTTAVNINDIAPSFASLTANVTQPKAIVTSAILRHPCKSIAIIIS